MDEVVLSNNNRVIADGGVVTDNTLMESYVKALKVRGLWDKCVFFLMGVNGVKKDDNDYCEKMYDLKGNADILQSDILQRPRHKRTGALLTDGGDGMMSDPLPVGNPIREATKITVMGIVKFSNVTTFQALISRIDVTTSSKCTFIISNGPASPYFNKLRFIIGNSTGGTSLIKLYYSSVPIVVGEAMHFAMTYENNDLKIYINGVLDTGVVKTTDGTTGLLHNSDQPISIMRFNNGTQPMANLGKIGALQIYNDILTPEEILWSAQYIRPIMQREVYGEVVGSHIDRAEDLFAVIDNANNLQTMYNSMVSANLWDNCVLCAVPVLTGCTRDTNSYVNRLFDIKNANDFIQTTGTFQPRFVDGVLVTDGEDIMSIPFGVPPQLRIRNQFTMVCYAKVFDTTLTNQSIFSRGRIGNITGFLFNRGVLFPRFVVTDFFPSTPVVKKTFQSTTAITFGSWVQLALTFDANAMDGSVKGLLKCYIDANEVATTKEINNDFDDNLETQDGYGIMDLANYQARPMGANGCVHSALVFDRVLSQSELNTLKSIIKPAGV